MAMPVQILGQTYNFMLRATGLVGQDGTLKTLEMVSEDKTVKITMPAAAFPFINANDPVLVILGVVKIAPKEPDPFIPPLIGLKQ